MTFREKIRRAETIAQRNYEIALTQGIVVGIALASFLIGWLVGRM